MTLVTTVANNKGIKAILSNPFVHVILIIVLGLIIYMNIFEAPFVFDDKVNVLNNPALRNFSYFTDVRLQDKALSNREISPHFRSRIVGYLTFALNYRLHGVRVTGYHVFNVLVHLINSILVYLLVLLTSRTPWFRRAASDREDPDVYRMASFFVALLFVSHPVQTGAVTYIAQRFTVLAAMFCLLSLVLYITVRLLKSEVRSQKPQQYALRYTLYAGSVLSAVLAMKTKEISFTLPVVIALYELLFFEGKAAKRLFYLLPLLLTMLIVPITALEDRNVLTDMYRLEASVRGAAGENQAVRYLLTQFRVLITYLRLLVLPINQNIDYDYPIEHTFFHPAVFLSFLFLAGIFASGIYLYRRSGKEGIPGRQWLRLAAFGIFWFFITLSVESTVIPLVDVIFEYRLYLPSAGFFMVVVSAAELLGRKFAKNGTRAVSLSLMLAILLLSTATVRRNQIWGDNIRLWEDTVKKSPNKARPHNSLGIVYQERGYTDKAVNEFLNTLTIMPDSAEAHYNLGNAYEKQGHIDMAINEYLDALKIAPDYDDAQISLAYAYEKQGRLDKTSAAYLNAAAYYYDAHYDLGITYSNQGNFNAAIDEFVAALKFKPASAEAHYYLGNAYAAQGRFDRAVNEFLAAVRIKPDFSEAHYNLGYAYANIGRISDAKREFKETLRINPQDANARMNLEILSRERTTKRK